MEIIRQEGSLTTPTILLDPDQGLIEIKGKSIPENSFEFYDPLYNWVKEYGENPQESTTVNLAMEYFNTSSSKEFMKFFQMLDDLHKAGKTKIIINWHYETDDEEMMEMGESLRKEIEIPIEIIAIDEI